MEKEKEEVQEEQTPPPPTKEEQEWDLDLIDKTNEAAVKLEQANKRLQRQILIQKRLQTESMLGGKAETNVQPEKELTPKEYAEQVLANDVEETTD